jgi:hypothetical protein
MWHFAPGGRQVFSTWQPAGVIRHIKEHGSGSKRLKQFRADLKRMADRILGREQMPDVQMDVFSDPGQAENFLKYLACHKKPWAFDIETYDAGQESTRHAVGVDPFHPDFRVRGVAIAWQFNRGAWIELMPWEDRKAEAAKLFGPVFASSAEKWAFNGSFDENGLVYSGWAPAITNRKGDGLLALIASNAGGHSGVSLARAVVDILGEPQYWVINKLTIRTAKLMDVADSAVRDACSTLKLTDFLHRRLEASEYFIPDEDDD